MLILIFFKVNINLEKEQQLGLPPDAEKLKAFIQLSKVFMVTPEDEHLHIVVKCPPRRCNYFY
jgi:hypothetical protein